VLVTQKGLKTWCNCIFALILNVLYIHVTGRKTSYSSVLQMLKESLACNNVAQ
jgi:hypothetical protein